MATNLNVSEIIEKATKAISSSSDLKKQFDKNPVKAIESATGLDLPDEIVNKVVDAVKAAIAGKNVSDAVNTLKGLFSK